jgi:hypothetical protein
MVVIGSDCVSFYPNLKKVESAEEAAEAVMEGNINWKETARFVALGRDGADRVGLPGCCRSGDMSMESGLG